MIVIKTIAERFNNFVYYIRGVQYTYLNVFISFLDPQ